MELRPHCGIQMMMMKLLLFCARVAQSCILADREWRHRGDFDDDSVIMNDDTDVVDDVDDDDDDDDDD